MGTVYIFFFVVGVLLTPTTAVDAKEDDAVKMTLSYRLAAIEATLERVLHKNEQLEKRVEALETENIHLKEVVRSLKHQGHSDQDVEVNDDKETEISTPNRLLNHRQGIKIQEFKPKQAASKRQLNSRSVAFTAVVGIASIKNLVDGQTIIYQKILANYGGGYDNTTGVFTVPVSGVYIFNFAEMIDPGHNEYLNLVKNGQHIILNYGHAIGANHLVSSSRTVAVECEVGDEVWVRAAPWSTHGSGQVHGYEFTTFSGWIVAPVNE